MSGHPSLFLYPCRGGGSDACRGVHQIAPADVAGGALVNRILLRSGIWVVGCWYPCMLRHICRDDLIHTIALLLLLLLLLLPGVHA